MVLWRRLFLNTNGVEWYLNIQDLTGVQCLVKVHHYQWQASPNGKIKLHAKYYTKAYIQIALHIHQVHSIIFFPPQWSVVLCSLASFTQLSPILTTKGTQVKTLHVNNMPFSFYGISHINCILEIRMSLHQRNLPNDPLKLTRIFIP